MMIWFTQPAAKGGRPLMVNPAHVVTVTIDAEGGVWITDVTGNMHQVSEMMTSVYTRLGGEGS